MRNQRAKKSQNMRGAIKAGQPRKGLRGKSAVVLTPKDVLEMLKSYQKQELATFISRYIGSVDHELRKKNEQSSLKFLGLKAPEIKVVLKEVEAKCRVMNDRDRWNFAQKLYELPVFEVRALGLDLLHRWQSKDPSFVSWKELKNFVNGIDNWANSDQLSRLVAVVMEREPTAVSKDLLVWSRSSNPWKRRQALVGWFYYVRQRRVLPSLDLVFQCVELLLEDSHFFVQKGVGWALRELSEVDPQQQRMFVERHLEKISATAWFAATERYTAKDRQELVARRRLVRRAPKIL